AGLDGDLELWDEDVEGSAHREGLLSGGLDLPSGLADEFLPCRFGIVHGHAREATGLLLDPGGMIHSGLVDCSTAPHFP
ncbi:hypothetical protein, partial [Klebsiella pneumoniae]|uniref:hypothetical protein n=1 Tax=Klebsiella pneumoniae TaxID=573 RepID=UPI0025A01C9C